MLISGWHSMEMWWFHRSLSSKIESQMCMSPLGYFGFCLVEVKPVVGCVVVVVLSIMVGGSLCFPRINAFLLVVRTPPLGLGWLIHAGRSRFGGLEFGPLTVFLR